MENGKQSFDAVAEAVAPSIVAVERPGPEVPPSEPAPEIESITVDADLARAVVSYSFLPVVLVTKDERWIPPSGEAELARPAMQKCLQQVFDRYLPALFAKYSPKHPEVFALAFALGRVGWKRYQFIAADNVRLAAERAEVAKREAAAHVTSIAAAAGVAPAVGAECRLCGFVSPDGSTAGLIDHQCKPGGAS